jgi:type I restriction enzyme S subunit
MSEWKEYKLAELSTKVGSGATPRGGDNSYKTSGISLIRSQNVLDLKFSNDGLAFIDDEQADELSNVTVQEGDILLNITGDSVARVCKVPKVVLPARVNQHVSIIRTNPDKLDSDFLLYQLAARKEELLSLAEIGATRRALTKGMIEEFPVKAPPLSEQRAIAAVLSSLDDKIDLLHRQNKTLEALAETLFRQWFMEEAEEGWEVGKLGDVITIFDSQRVPLSSVERDKMKEGQLYPYYGAATIMDYVNDYLFDGEYLLMGEDGTVQTDDGYPILQLATGKFWVNNHAHIFQANVPYSNFMLYILLKQTNISHIVTGAVQPKINQANLKSIEFPVAPMERVKEIVSITDGYWLKIKNNHEHIRTLTQMRDTLLPKLMKGEIRVESEEWKVKSGKWKVERL